MKALSIKQPWADFILQGIKTIEIRVWRGIPQVSFPMKLAIHTGKNGDIDAFNFFRFNTPFPKLVMKGTIGDYPNGALIGYVEFIGIIVYDTSIKFRADYSKHLNPVLPVAPEDFQVTPGSGRSKVLGLQFSNPEIIKPEPYRGELGLFDLKGGDWDSRTNGL